MRIFKRKKKSDDKVEVLLKPTLEMIYDLDRTEFNRYMDGVKLLYDGVQKFRKVKTIDEKENGDPDIEQIEKVLEKESKKKEIKK